MHFAQLGKDSTIAEFWTLDLQPFTNSYSHFLIIVESANSSVAGKT
jgi:hypothetical protein